MKRLLPLVLVIIFLAAGIYAWQNSRGLGPAIAPPPEDIDDIITETGSINATDFPLTLPDGFAIEIFASDLSGVREIVQDGFGNFWVSRPSEGVVTQLEVGSGGIVRTNDIFRGLRKPHGLAITPDGNTLFIAEEHQIIRALLYSDAPVETVASLPPGGRHTTRTIAYGPDERLYISIGSTCDVCDENNPEHAAIISMNLQGDDRRIVATGLRNSVFFDWSYVTGDMFATDMGRDHLGDNLPPEEVNIIKNGAQPASSAAADYAVPHYGWPYCYGKQVRDQTFRPDASFDCASTVSSHLELPAHIAPLDLAFVPEEGWPEEWWYDLLVAEHGSWNSTEPVGYKIVRIPLDAQGNPEGEPVDFIGGWLQGNRALGRPVALLIQPGGTLYITDDKAGVVYRLRRISE